MTIIESLSKYQHRVLKKLANGKVKAHAVFSGLPNEKSENVINEDFNKALRLVQLRLMVDITEDAKKTIDFEKYAATGRDIAILQLTNRGQGMFERNGHDKWVN